MFNDPWISLYIGILQAMDASIGRKSTPSKSLDAVEVVCLDEFGRDF